MLSGNIYFKKQQLFAGSIIKNAVLQSSLPSAHAVNTRKTSI